MIGGNFMQQNPNGMVRQTPYGQSNTSRYGQSNVGFVPHPHQHVNMDPTYGRETSQYFRSPSFDVYNSDDTMIGDNLMQQNPNSMVNPIPYGQYNTIWSVKHHMVNQTPYGQSNTLRYGQSNVGFVPHPHQHVYMDPTYGRETSQYSRSPIRGIYNSRLPAIESSDTVDWDIPRRKTPYIEEYSDDTHLVHRKHNVGFGKKKRDFHEQETEYENNLRKLDSLGKFSPYSSTRLFDVLRQTKIPGTTSQAILEAVKKSWCIRDTKVYLVVTGENNCECMIQISRGSNHLNILAHENGLWYLDWIEKTCTKKCMDGLSAMASCVPFLGGGVAGISALFKLKK
ncbi:uncharacterized protein LOC127721295 [Mytilus californianus]|uniref:uncharacterized protein LOC127721295 n=1 Tax=Mytilus californianus TaxID=6549 RepID=UPI002247D28F|nr:uncharacterized protein LOC127721295 [Mytilus californianus]